MKRKKASAASVLSALNILNDDEMSALADNPGKVKEFLAARVQEEIDNTFVTPLSDREVREQFPQFTDRIAPWRKFAALSGYAGPVAWLIREGFTLKKHAPLAGPCNDNLSCLESWDFSDDPTESCLVFWVPSLAEKSTDKTLADMEEYRAELKKRYEFPEGHATTFGSVQLLFALIMAHFKRTGERLLQYSKGTVSDTANTDGNRLVPGVFGNIGINCYCWDGTIYYDDDSFGCIDSIVFIGFFLLGVEKLG